MKKLFVLAIAVLALTAGAVEYKFEFKSNKPNIVKAGEEITWSVSVLSRENAKAAFAPLKGVKVLCRVIAEKNQISRNTVVTADKPFTVTGKLTQPGWIYLRCNLLDEKGKDLKVKDKRGKMSTVYGGIGTLVEPEKFKVGKEEPKDFDAFWKSRRAMLDKVPFNAKVTELPKAPRGFKLYDVQLDCAGGMPMSGYLCVPVGAKPKSLPAVLSYQGAGVSSSWVSCNKGAITMNINAHGIPNGKPAAFYQNLGKTTLKSYYHKGKNDREKIYFHGMYLRVMRSLDYMKSRPEWDGKTLIVSGSSQGGGQAIAAAGLDPRVTLCIAAVPAMSDHSGSIANRQPGWPQFYNVSGSRKADPKVVDAVAYYDNAFFARRIKCETWLTTGLFDTTCSPSSVYTVFNNLAAKKKYIDIVPAASHSGAPARKGHARMRDIIDGK